MADRPNILILMCDQLQAQVLRGDHPCATPMLDRYLLRRGLHFVNGYTSNAICSPARASLMTGLLPHNHGVLTVTHTVDRDQSCLREDKPHFAQRLQAAGYRTGYFGKWHIERSNELERFGWQDHESDGSQRLRERAPHRGTGEGLLRRDITAPEGYPPKLFYGHTDAPMEKRRMGAICDCADEWLADRLQTDEGPWCCMVSTPEPHDPYVCSPEAYEAYAIDRLPLPASRADRMADKPGLYRRAARIFEDLDDRAHREALGCYYASISEIDAQFGRLLQRLDEAGRLDDTVVVLCADHGDLMGAHGLWMKNFSAFEEVYNIPFVWAGPGIAADASCPARVGLHDVADTLCELLGAEPMGGTDGGSFAHLLRDPADLRPGDEEGFAEYHGGRYILTQRVLWQGDWKYVFNGFDEDELYHLAEDPHECCNRIADPRARSQAETMMRRIWQILQESGDHSLANSPYPILRLGLVGWE